MDRSYGIDDYQPSRGNGLGFGLEPSTFISVLAFLAFLLHALLILLIPTLKSFFSGPFFGHGIGYNNGFGGGGFGGGPGFGGGGYGGLHNGGYGTVGSFGYGAIPSILGGVNGILGTGLLGTTGLLSTGLSGIFGPGVAGLGAAAPAAAAASGPLITRGASRGRAVDEKNRTWMSEDKTHVKPIGEMDRSTGRNIMKTTKLLSKCNFYFCLFGKTKFDHMLVLRERK